MRSPAVSSKMNGEDVTGKTFFGRFSDADMLAQLKRLALDPRNEEFSRVKVQPLYNQTLRVRQALALNNSALPRRKRNLDSFVKDTLRAASSPGSVSVKSKKSKSVQKSIKVSKGKGSLKGSSSTSASMVTFEKPSQDKKQRCCRTIDWRTSSGKIIIPDSDDSVNGSNPLTPENEPPSLSVLDLPQVKVVPVSTRFQADVPEWTGPVQSTEEDSKWLGTCMVPFNEHEKVTEQAVGEGRADTCSCENPGSSMCAKRHIAEGRLNLLCDLGAAFFSCKINEMGEEVAREWTVKDQESFEVIVKTRKNFLKHAVKSFPHKSEKEVVSYYLNVFIPRRISLRTRKSLEQVDSDEDEDETDNGSKSLNTAKPRKSGGGGGKGGGRVTRSGGGAGGSKAVKPLYRRKQ